MPLDKHQINPNPKPAIVAYNRLEVSPRSSEYERSLRGEVRDPLWMLARQWQVGEFEAQDGGSVFNIKVLSNRRRMETLTGGETLAGTGGTPLPLEYLVEREHRAPDLALRIESGKLFRALTEEALTISPTWLLSCLERYRLSKLENTEPSLYAQIQADTAAFILYESLKTKTIDGLAIYQNILLSSPQGFNAWVQSLASLDQDQQEEALYIGQSFRSAFEQFYGIPGDQAPAYWISDRMEYQFSLGADQGAAKLVAEQYYQGNLDWHAFDLAAPLTTASAADDRVDTFFPGQVNYVGVSRGRWWEMEEQALNFGKVPAKSTDLLTMVMLDFALIYGNDWLLLPLPLEVNSLCQVKGLLVTDVFGIHTLIPAADTKNAPSWQKWSLFHLGQKDERGKRESVLYLSPSLLKRQEAEQLEQVAFRRDEMANLVWAFEQKVPGVLGQGQNAYEFELKTDPPPPGGLPRYVLGTAVPSYQIPFIPVHINPADPSNAQTRLQRARMPDGTAPRSLLLTERPAPFYIQEEEIPREGITVSRRWQRTRWINGQTLVWVGREKELGKGDVKSGLAFDQVV